MSETVTPNEGPARFVAALRKHGYDFFAGVPCSLLKGLVTLLDQDPELHYISATREDSAVGMAVGAWMAGRRPVLLMQNSGLGVAVNALSSLMLMYQTPALLVISWRGEGGDDAPEHILMGEIMLPLLDLLKIPYRVMRDVDGLAADVGWATEQLVGERRTVALVAPKGVLQ